MKHLFLILPCCLIFLISRAQSRDSVVSKQIRDRVIELKTQGAKLPVSYYVNCVGYRKIYDPTEPCKVSDVRYLFWKSKNTYFVQRFDDCNNYSPVEIKEKLIDKITGNLKTIKTAKIDYPKYISEKNGVIDTIRLLAPDHSCRYTFEIYTADENVIVDIDEIASDTKKVDNKYENLNYRKNQRSILIKLKNMADRITSTFNKKAP